MIEMHVGNITLRLLDLQRPEALPWGISAVSDCSTFSIRMSGPKLLESLVEQWSQAPRAATRLYVSKTTNYTFIDAASMGKFRDTLTLAR